MKKDKNKNIIWVKKEKTAELQIQLSNGTIATEDEMQQLIFWPSIRLRIKFGGGYREYRTQWQKSVSEFIFQLTKLAKFSWTHQETIPGSHWTAAVLRPIVFDRATVKKWLARNIFHAHPSDPLMLLRTGDKFDVHYETGLLIYHDRIEFYLPPTEENVQFLEKLVADLVKNKLMDKISFEYADMSYGLTGWIFDFTYLKITKNIRKMLYPEKGSPIFGSKWLLWIGDLWQATEKHHKILEIFNNNPHYKIERQNKLQKITTTQPSSCEDIKNAQFAKELSENLDTVVKKMDALESRILQPIIEHEEKILLKKLEEKWGKKVKRRVAFLSEKKK